MRKLLLITCISLIAALGLQFGVSNVWAARKRVDCAKVMKELATGKKVAVVAKDQKISRSSVYRCRRRARAEAKEKAKVKTKGNSNVTAAASKK